MNTQSFLTFLQTEKFFGKTVWSDRNFGAKLFCGAFLGGRLPTFFILHGRYKVVKVVTFALTVDYLSTTFDLEFI